MENEFDFSVFLRDEERDAFREVLQTYYSKNYRSSIVMLYSLLVYDLYEKLQVIAIEGSKEATSELQKIREGLESVQDKYSHTEKILVDFFKTHFSSYFNSFSEDIDFLKCLRDKCSHLRIDGQSLYVPKEYQVRMVIYSMYNNVFSKEAPFITNLYYTVREDVSYISKKYGVSDMVDEKSELYELMRRKFFKRMTEDSLITSYRSFYKLAYISKNEVDVNNFQGLFLFLFGMTRYAINKGIFSIWSDAVLLSHFENTCINLTSERIKGKSLFILFSTLPKIRDSFRSKNGELFTSIVNEFLYENTSRFCKNVRQILPDIDARDVIFGDNKKALGYLDFECLYDFFFTEYNMGIDEFFIKGFDLVPTYNGFDSADSYCSYLKKRFFDLSNDALNKIFNQYFENSQFTNRKGSKSDISWFMDNNRQRSEPLDEILFELLA